MSSMKIFIRKVNTFLSPRLSYHKEESTYFIVLTFTECSTNTHASSPNCLGDGIQQQEAPGGLGRAGVPRGRRHGQPTTWPPARGGDPREAETEKGRGFPSNHDTQGKRQNFPLLFHPHRPSVDQKKLGKTCGSGRRQVRGFEQRGQWGPPLGLRGPAAGREPCSLEGGRALAGGPRASSSRGRAHSSPVLPVDSTAQKPPMCTSALSPPTDERHPRVLTAHLAARQAPTGAATLGSPPGTPRDWRAFRPRGEAAGSAESPGPGHSGAEGRTLPSCQLRRGSVPPRGPGHRDACPRPTCFASPTSPPCVQKLSWREAGHSLEGSWDPPPNPASLRSMQSRQQCAGPRHVRG